MREYIDIINESLDSNVPFTWIDEDKAEFEIDGRDYCAYFSGSQGNYEIDFAMDRDGYTAMPTGTGDEFKVYGTMAAIVRDFMSRHRVRYFRITSGGETESRNRLNLALAKRLAKAIGYTMEVEGRSIYLDAPSLNEDYEEEDGLFDGDEPMLEEAFLKAGTIVMHGTNSEFEERHGLSSPVWVTNSEDVAAHFANWRGGDGRKRITFWKVEHDIRLCVMTKEYLDWLYDYQNMDTSPDSIEDVTQILRQRGFGGWTIPDNYGPGKADILLDNTDALSYIKTKKI